MSGSGTGSETCNFITGLKITLSDPVKTTDLFAIKSNRRDVVCPDAILKGLTNFIFPLGTSAVADFVPDEVPSRYTTLTESTANLTCVYLPGAK